jgi:hypothetical protein
LVFTEKELEDKYEELQSLKEDKRTTSKDFEEINRQERILKKDTFEILNVQMQVLTWGDYNKFQENATKTDMEGNRHFDFKIYKEDRLKNLVVSWDAKDESGNDIPYSYKLVTRLPFQIGEAIIKGYDEETYYDEEEEKK